VKIKPVEAHVARVVSLYENLSPADVARLPMYYAAGAWFKDPFNDVHGVPEVQRIFEHMFTSLEKPRFVVGEAVSRGEHCFLTWEMQFRLRRLNGAEQSIRGATHLVFDMNGLIVVHRDYWDAAEELYEKLPILGALMRWLRRRVNRS
jgi:ketosteroid isomerase-like protein